MSTERQREQAHVRGYGCFWKSVGVMLVSTLACGLGATSCVLVKHNHNKQQLAMVVERIRVTGEPLDGAELNAFYKVPPDENDLTSLYVRALSPMMENNPQSRQFHQDARGLPIVGENQNPIPPKDQPWSDQQAVEQFLAKYQESLDLLREAGRQSGSVRYPLDFRDGYAMLLPHAQAVRNAARILELETRLRLRAGDDAGAAESLLALLKAGESLKEEPIIISQLVRTAALGMFVQELQNYLQEAQPGDSDLAMLQAAVAEVDLQAGMSRALMGERSMAYETMANSDLKAIHSLQSGGAPPPAALEWLSGDQTMMSFRPGDSAMLLITLTEMVQASKHPYPTALDEAAAADTRLTQFFAQDDKRLPWDRHILTKLLLPALNRTTSSVAQRTAMQRTLLAMLAIERYRLAHEGELPAKLDDLVPDFLDAVPTDPFDGQPLRLLRTEKGYLVYSVGSDKLDQQGNVGGEPTNGLDIGFRRENTEPDE